MMMWPMTPTARCTGLIIRHGGITAEAEAEGEAAGRCGPLNVGGWGLLCDRNKAHPLVLLGGRLSNSGQPIGEPQEMVATSNLEKACHWSDRLLKDITTARTTLLRLKEQDVAPEPGT